MEVSSIMQRGRYGVTDEQIERLIIGDAGVNEIFGSGNNGTQEDSDQLSYDEEDIIIPSKSVGLAKEVMKRLLKLQKQIKTLKQNIESIIRGNDSRLESSDIHNYNNKEDMVKLLQEYDEVHIFLWGRLARLLHEEHQRCADVYTNTLNINDRVPFESLTHTIHHNTPFCDYMGEIVNKTIDRGNLFSEIEIGLLQQAMFNHNKNLEHVQILATYCALLVVEGSRESFLDPLSIYDLCNIVVEEKSRRKRLLALSLTFSMLDQDDQAIGEALSQQLPRILLQRTRHLVHRIFGYPDKNVLISPIEDRGSPFRYYNAVIQSDTNSPFSSRKASPEINNGNGNTTIIETPILSSGIELIQNSTLSSQPLIQRNGIVDTTQVKEISLNNNEIEIPDIRRRRIRCLSNENEITEGPLKIRKIEKFEEETINHKNFKIWKPQKGEKVGRGPAWEFENQGESCDKGEIIEITTGEELLVRWLKNIDSINNNNIKYRIFRYKYKKPYEHVVPWNFFLHIKTMNPEDINFKIEEFMLNCALVGALCHQRETVLPALQFQTIESMIHVLDSLNLSDVASAAKKAEEEAEEQIRILLGSKEEDEAVDEDALEIHLNWDINVHLAKERYRQVREIIARVGWVLSTLLYHKKLAFIFLELNGLQRIMTLINGNMEVSTTYGCCIVLSRLAKSAVFEKLLKNHGEYFEPILKFILYQWESASNHDVQGSAGEFIFNALSFPCVVSFFDIHQGPQTTVGTIKRLLNNSDERFDVVCPELTLVALKCIYVYLVSHLMLSTRVIFRRHRFLSVIVTNSSPEKSLPLDPATVESVLGFLSAASSSNPDISIETVQSLLTRDRLVAFRSLLDNNFHQLLLQCTQFYFSQSRWELLAASLNVLSVLAVVPFIRPLIAGARYPESGIVHLIMIVSDLAAAFQSGNTSRESHLIPCVATALQILLYLTVPPTDKNDETAVATFNHVCSVIRASDGVRTLLEILRIKKDAAMSAKLHFFPVVARALQLMVTLRRYADTSLLFDALGVSAVARELLSQYNEVQREYISMMGSRYAATEMYATGRFMENAKCFLFDEANQATLTVSIDPVELEQRQAIIARSHISYSRESLLELISQYLETEGLQNAASVLRRDANISLDSPIFQQSSTVTTDMAALSTIGLPTLDGIIRSYLRQQHEKCTNPIATLPKFDLRKNHVYYPPAPPVEHTRNSFNRRLAQKMGDDFSLRMKSNENHLMYRYPGHLFDITGGGDGLQGDSITFCDNGETLMVGTSEGAIAFFDTFPDDSSSDKLLEQHLVFDDDGVSGLFVSGDGSLLAAISTSYTVAIMKRDELPVIKYSIEGCRAAQFSNTNTYLLATCDEEHTCRLYDISAQREVHHFSDPSWVGENLNNVATFDSSSQLILSDAVLWDIRCSDKPVYRFDRFTESFSNAFHPSNLLVLIDEKVWDLRTLTMLQTVPSFKKTSSFHINNFGRVIYSFREASSLTNSNSPVLSVVESYTFETVFSTEVRPPFKAFAIDPSDRYCAAILEQDVESVIRVFSTSSGPLPGQQSFPLPQDVPGNESDDEIGENEDEMDQDGSWSSGDDTDDEDDDWDEEEEESELNYTNTVSDTESYETEGQVVNDSSTITEQEVEEIEELDGRTEEMEESPEASISST